MTSIRIRQLKRWTVVALFAIAMAWVESAVVLYLRTMIHRLYPYQANPLPVIGGLGPVEMVRELATLVMLLTIGMLAGRTWRSRIGYTAVAFGLWDIFYYVFLKVMCGWPQSLLDWDILFLLPLPWWGPVLAPVLIALLMIAWGTLASQLGPARTSLRSGVTAWSVAVIGMAVALWVFMYDSLRVAGQGVEVIRNTLPTRFNWPLFVVGLVLMSCPVAALCREFRRRPRVERPVEARSARSAGVPPASEPGVLAVRRDAATTRSRGRLRHTSFESRAPELSGKERP